VKIVQPVQRRYEWTYLVLLVDGERGRLWWTWQPTMKSDHLLGTVRGIREHGYVDAVVWDGAPAHRERRVRELGLPLVELPPYSPELNPVERIFEEIRRHGEGETYATLADKQAKVEAYLHELDAAPDRVRSLAGWDWIHDALTQLAA
jgi:DDE superfamily endonuclease